MLRWASLCKMKGLERKLTGEMTSNRIKIVEGRGDMNGMFCVSSIFFFSIACKSILFEVGVEV